MKLHPPFIITVSPAPSLRTARLAPGLRIGDSHLSLLRIDHEAAPDGRDQAVFVLDTPTFEYHTSDLRSGCQGFASMVEPFASMLGFMAAAAGAYRHEMGMHSVKSDNHDLFPDHVMEWCYENEDEISLLGCDICDEGGAPLHHLIEEN